MFVFSFKKGEPQNAYVYEYTWYSWADVFIMTVFMEICALWKIYFCNIAYTDL